MNLLSDLFQTLLIPLAVWDVRLLGLEASLPVTPLLLIVVGVLLDRARRGLVRRFQAARSRPDRPQGWSEPHPRMATADS